jgi:hypothetical protein
MTWRALSTSLYATAAAKAMAAMGAAAKANHPPLGSLKSPPQRRGNADSATSTRQARADSVIDFNRKWNADEAALDEKGWQLQTLVQHVQNAESQLRMWLQVGTRVRCIAYRCLPAIHNNGVPLLATFHHIVYR